MYFQCVSALTCQVLTCVRVHAVSSRHAAGHGDFKAICDLSSLRSIENTKGIECCYNFLAMITLQIFF